MTAFVEQIERAGMHERTTTAARQAEELYATLAGQQVQRATADGVDRFLKGLQRRARASQAAGRTCAQRWLTARRAVQYYGRTAAVQRMGQVVISKALRLHEQDGDWTRKAFSEEEAAKFMAAAMEVEKPGWVRPLFALFAATGARLSELIGLRMKDVDVEAGTLHVVGKFSRERLVAVIGEEARLWLTAHEATRRNEGAGPESALFVTYQGKAEHGRWYRETQNDERRTMKEQSREARHVSARAVQWWGNKLAGRAGVKLPGRCVHVFRHTLATRLAEKDLALQKIAVLMGHVKVSTTMRYTHLRAEDARAAAEALLQREK